MKGFEEIEIPNDRSYSDDHEWAKKIGDIVRVGISDFAQDQMGDIVYVELPAIGRRIDTGEEFGVIESVKTVSDCLLPTAGEVIAVNGTLTKSPELVNGDPYGDGWMLEIKPDDFADLETLMDASAYREFLKKG